MRYSLSKFRYWQPVWIKIQAKNNDLMANNKNVQKKVETYKKLL